MNVGVKLREQLDDFRHYANAEACIIISDSTKDGEEMGDVLNHFMNSIKYSAYIVSVLDFYVDEDEWNPHGQRGELRELSDSLIGLLPYIQRVVPNIKDGKVHKLETLRDVVMQLISIIEESLEVDE